MRTRNLIRFLFALSATFVGLTQGAHAQTKFPPAWVNTATYAPGDLVTDYGNIYRCETTVTTPYLDPSKTYQDWELYSVRSGTTLTIGAGQTFPTLAIAWNYVRNCHIAMAAYLHLDIVTTTGNHSETFDAPLNLDQISGSQISIIGDTEANITLTFPNSNGITIDTGHSFGSISNVSIVGNGSSAGVYSLTSSDIANLSNIDISGCQVCVDADQSSKLVFGSYATLETTLIGVGAYDGASVSFAPGLKVTGHISSGMGLDAESLGRIYAEGCELTQVYIGANSEYGGYAFVDSSTIQHCSFGLQASYAGIIEAEGCSFNHNSMYELYASQHGVIDATSDPDTSVYASSGGDVFFTP